MDLTFESRIRRALPDLAMPEAVRRDILWRMAGGFPVAVAAMQAGPADR
jgi:hypothetical protein